MFEREALLKIDRNYFDVILTDDYDTVIRSKNTGHYWYLHCTGEGGRRTIAIFHKHNYSHPYHWHAWAASLTQALRMIRKHDTFQMNGREPIR